MGRPKRDYEIWWGTPSKALVDINCHLNYIHQRRECLFIPISQRASWTTRLGKQISGDTGKTGICGDSLFIAKHIQIYYTTNMSTSLPPVSLPSGLPWEKRASFLFLFRHIAQNPTPPNWSVGSPLGKCLVEFLGGTPSPNKKGEKCHWKNGDPFWLG